jgi:hypothetical protein
MLRAKYTGDVGHLKGHTALVQEVPNSAFLKVQFDVPNTFRDPRVLFPYKNWQADSLGFGWHDFPRTDFRLETA